MPCDLRPMHSRTGAALSWELPSPPTPALAPHSGIWKVLSLCMCAARLPVSPSPPPPIGVSVERGVCTNVLCLLSPSGPLRLPPSPLTP